MLFKYFRLLQKKVEQTFSLLIGFENINYIKSYSQNKIYIEILHNEMTSSNNMIYAKLISHFRPGALKWKSFF